MERYLPPELLRRWETALGPLLAGGGTLDVRLEAVSVEATTPESARVAFTDLTSGAARRWRLELLADPATGLVRDAWFARLEG